MTNEKYHQHPAIGSTALNCFLRSRREFEARYVNRTLPSDESDAMDFGSVLHWATLEPERLWDSVAEIPDDVLTSNGQRRGKKWDEYKSANAGKRLLKAGDWRQVRGMLDAIRENPLVREFLRLPGEREKPIFWPEARSGVACKCKPDILTERVIIDVKTTVDASPDAFTRTILRYGYHRQAALYRAGVQMLTGDMLPFLFVVIQKTEPYTCRVFRIGDDELQLGAADVSEGLAVMAKCFDASDFREPGEHEETTLHFPGWAMRRREEEVAVSDGDWFAAAEELEARMADGRFFDGQE